MNTLMLLKNVRKKILLQGYFKNKEEAMQRWAKLPASDPYEILYLEERKPRGHRYELVYAKFDDLGYLNSKYIICFSKKEALYLENKIKEVDREYSTQIEKIY